MKATLIIGPANGGENIAERPATGNFLAPDWLENAARNLALDNGVPEGTPLVAYLYNDEEDDVDASLDFTV